MCRIPALALVSLTVGICGGCSSMPVRVLHAHLVATSLGFEGCAASGPLTSAQVLEGNKKSGTSQPDPSRLGRTNQQVRLGRSHLLR